MKLQPISRIWLSKVTYRVNNLRMCEDLIRNQYVYIAPDGRVLESFERENDCILAMQDNHDFLTDIGYYRKYGRKRHESTN